MKHDLGVITCDICQQLIIKEKNDGLHYPKNDYHVSCVVERLRAKTGVPEAVTNEKCVEETEAVV